MNRPRSWWPDAVFVAAFALITIVLIQGHLLGADAAVADWADAHRPPAAYWTARVLNFLGQGGWLLMPLAGLVAVLLIWRRGSVRPALVWLGGTAVTYLSLGPMKIFFQRAAPGFTGPDRTEFFNPAAVGDLGMSYPSGHVANAVVWWAIIVFLLKELTGGPGRWLTLAMLALPAVIVMGTTTYLTWHWMSDAVAGLFLGLILTRVLARVPWWTMPLPEWARRYERETTPVAH